MKRVTPHTRYPDFAPAAGFVAFLVVGAIYIIYAKYFNVFPWLVAAVPVVLMFSYALLIFIMTAFRLRSDQTGDNFYYMGFLYTLTSLGVSLYQFSNNGNVDEIIRNFGIAISSTIAGIAFRIVFVQFRRDPMEVEHVSRLELSHAAQKVRRELDGLNLEFAHFRRTNQQMLEEGYSEIRQKVTAAADAMLADLDRFSKAAAARIQESNHALDLQSVRTQISETETAIRALNGAIALANAEVAAAANLANDRLKSMAGPDKIIEISMKPVVDGLQKSVDLAVARMGRGIEEASNIGTRLDQILLRLSTRAAVRNLWPFKRGGPQE